MPAFYFNKQTKFTQVSTNKCILDLAKFNQIITDAQDPPLNQNRLLKNLGECSTNPMIQHRINSKTYNAKKDCFEPQHHSSFPAF